MEKSQINKQSKQTIYSWVSTGGGNWRWSPIRIICLTQGPRTLGVGNGNSKVGPIHAHPLGCWPLRVTRGHCMSSGSWAASEQLLEFVAPRLLQLLQQSPWRLGPFKRSFLSLNATTWTSIYRLLSFDARPANKLVYCCTGLDYVKLFLALWCLHFLGETCLVAKSWVNKNPTSCVFPRSDSLGQSTWKVATWQSAVHPGKLQSCRC